jgi:hypothetical protein
MLPCLADLTLLLLAGVPQDPVAVGAEAPPFAWYTRGGNAARTGVSAARGPQTPLVLAWEHQCEDPIVGEPLVWDDRIVLELDAGTSRLLRVLDLRTGQPIGPDRRYPKVADLGPSLWRDLVVIRSGERELSALRIRGNRLLPVWTFPTESAVGQPLCFAGEVYAATERGLLRTRVGRRSADWTVGPGMHGRVSLRGDLVLSASMNVAGDASLYGFRRNDGKEMHKLLSGAPAYRQLDMNSGATLAVFDGALIAEYPVALKVGGSGEVRFVGFEWPPTALIAKRVEGMWSLAAPACDWEEGWFGSWFRRAGVPALVLQQHYDDDHVLLLATSETDRAFAGARVGATRAGSVGFLGAQAFDLNSWRVLWRLPVEASARLVPLRSHLLVVSGQRRLIALQEALDATAHAASAPVAASEQAGTISPLALASGVAYLRGRESVRGALTWDAVAGRLSEAKTRGASWPASEVLYLEDAELGVLHALDLRAGLELLIEEAEAAAWTELALEAVKSNDPGLLGECLGRAEALGAEERALTAPRRTLETWNKKAPKVKEDVAILLRARLAEVEAIGGRIVEERVERTRAELPGGAARDPLVEIGLLRLLLQLDPQHAGARAAVRDRLPEGLRDQADGLRASVFPALDWLDVIEAGVHVPITILDPAPGAPPPAGASEFAVRALERARADWRPDAIAFQSPNLLIVTSLDRPGALARCLALGELVCEMLEETFRGVGAAAGGAAAVAGGDARPPLVVQLFGTKEEYLERSEKWYGEEGSGLTWTAGYYDPNRNMTRLFVPSDDAGFEETRATLAHEITHHWLQVRCPAFTASARDEAMFEQPGVWIVEGFASFVDEFRFRTDLRRWSAEQAFSQRLDLVASAGEGALLPWQDLFHHSKAAFEDLSAADEVEVPCGSQLGPVVWLPSSKALFYAQAAVATRYLFLAEDGRHRRALLEFLAAWYEGRADGFDLAAAVGMSAEELGVKVQAYAREVFGKVPGVK